MCRHLFDSSRCHNSRRNSIRNSSFKELILSTSCWCSHFVATHGRGWLEAEVLNTKLKNFPWIWRWIFPIKMWLDVGFTPRSERFFQSETSQMSHSILIISPWIDCDVYGWLKTYLCFESAFILLFILNIGSMNTFSLHRSEQSQNSHKVAKESERIDKFVAWQNYLEFDLCGDNSCDNSQTQAQRRHFT